jgi:hypothetical protein
MSSEWTCVKPLAAGSKYTAELRGELEEKEKKKKEKSSRR